VTHQLLLCAVLIYVGITNNIKKITEAPMDAGKEGCLEVNTEKNKYTLLSSHQNPGQRNIT
jgi:hypothetical protein